MEISGVYEEAEAVDMANGQDIIVFGSIGDSDESYVLVEARGSLLDQTKVEDGDVVFATIRPADSVEDSDDELYEILTIRKP
jgi:hypothetical protein